MILGVLVILGVGIALRPIEKETPSWAPVIDNVFGKIAGLVPPGDVVYEKFLRGLLVYPDLLAGIVLLAIVLSAVTKVARHKMRQIYFDFWRERLHGPWWD